MTDKPILCTDCKGAYTKDPSGECLSCRYCERPAYGGPKKERFRQGPNLLKKAIGYLDRNHPDGAPWSEHDGEVVNLVEMMRPASAVEDDE